MRWEMKKVEKNNERAAKKKGGHASLMNKNKWDESWDEEN